MKGSKREESGEEVERMRRGRERNVARKEWKGCKENGKKRKVEMGEKEGCNKNEDSQHPSQLYILYIPVYTCIYIYI